MVKTRTLFLAVAGGLFALTAATSGFSQTAAPAAGEDALAETWERAQAQIETCKGLEGKMRYDLAARCYDDVAEMLTVAAGAKTGSGRGAFADRSGREARAGRCRDAPSKAHRRGGPGEGH